MNHFDKIFDKKLEAFVPFGEELRELLFHPSLSKGVLRIILQRKGIFLSQYEDKDIIPFLTTILLSAKDFDFIKGHLKSQEDKRKTTTRTFELIGDSDLLDVIPNAFNIKKVIKESFPRYALLGDPNFHTIGGDRNKIAVDFVCVTSDYSKSFHRTTTEFPGTVTISREVIGSKVNLVMEYTSIETKDVTSKISAQLEKELKLKGFIKPDKGIRSVRFSDFTNQNRIKFFLKTLKGNDVFKFFRVRHLDLGPDLDLVEGGDIPHDIKWMNNARVKDLNINGETLHKVDFVVNEDLQHYILLGEMTTDFDFNFNLTNGRCKVKYGFGSLLSRNIMNAELNIQLSITSLKDPANGIDRAKIERKLQALFSKYLMNLANSVPKTELYSIINE